MKPEQVTPRWQRRYPQQRFIIGLFGPPFVVGEMLPGTFVYQRLVLAVALQQTWHVLRSPLRRLVRWAP